MHLISIFMISLLIILQFPPNKSSSEHHFVLVHGACHGAWSWYKLVALMKSSSGHINVTALDLAASGIDSKQAKNLISIADYFKPLMEFMESVPLHEKVVLVGHSLGGLAVSKAMERFPSKISVAVFVTAGMPGPDLNISTLNQESFRRQGSMLDSKYTYDNGPNNPPTTITLGPLYLASNVYQLSPTQDWALATTLMRPVRLFSEEDISRELVLSRENYGYVKRVFIVSEKDMVLEKDLALWMIKRNPPHQVVEIKGSDHMVMMSKPTQLWVHLIEIATKYT
ncbi:hypothetical protein QYF36_009765 [Acer negundo]|nr:hypothetical protein QYF36_009765 [Acer negundo]